MGREQRTTQNEKAQKLRGDPRFLYLAGQAISDLGVVGEERNRLIILLAGLSKELPEPVSVLIKGPSSSGKSNLVRTTLQLFPPESVLERASLSAKAPVHTEESFAEKILYIQEYRGGKDSHLLVRLLQSEGKVAHEYTTIRGQSRSTEVAEQTGRPVVLTTTTDARVYPDDETRFLSCWIDESAAQTAQIVKAQVHQQVRTITPALGIWRRALSLVTMLPQDFQSPPEWLMSVAEDLPAGNVRTRRDWKRSLTFCKAAALLRRPAKNMPVNIEFSDYAVVYKLLEPALAATAYSVHPQELGVIQAVEAVAANKPHVTVRDITEYLGWKDSLVYKYVKSAVKHHRIEVKSGTHEHNKKFIIPVPDRNTGFLPRPSSVFRKNKELGNSARYVDPLTGKAKFFRRDRKAGA